MKRGAPMVLRDDVMRTLRTIDDPEMPLSIVDLGIVEQVSIADAPQGAAVDIMILPTFVGCPALDMIRGLIVQRVGAMPGVGRVTVEFRHDPPWSVDRISDAGRASLAAHGVTVPAHGCTSRAAEPIPLGTSVLRCPWCGSDRTRLDSPFGPTRCRMIFYCTACRNTFEHMKAV